MYFSSCAQDRSPLTPIRLQQACTVVSLETEVSLDAAVGLFPVCILTATAAHSLCTLEQAIRTTYVAVSAKRGSQMNQCFLVPRIHIERLSIVLVSTLRL